jgi:hypothetical protein
MTRSDDYLWDRSGDVDPEIERLERLLSPLKHDAPLDELRLRRKRSRLPIIIGAITAIAATVTLLLWWRSGPGVTACSGGVGMAFTAKSGEVGCQDETLARGVLPIGGTLDTRTNAAELVIADIGRAELGPNTRVRLDVTQQDRHQLFLERGRMHARVVAVPRVFSVGTPSANVTDLGCEYTLEVDDAGAGSIRVITGMVELENQGAIVVVPAGAHARLLAGRRAGLPLDERASPELAAAVRAYEDRASDALARVLAAPLAKRDAITLANLARVAPVAQQRSVLERLAALHPAPQDTTVDEALADPDLLTMWFDDVIDARW